MARSFDTGPADPSHSFWPNCSSRSSVLTRSDENRHRLSVATRTGQLPLFLAVSDKLVNGQCFLASCRRSGAVPLDRAASVFVVFRASPKVSQPCHKITGNMASAPTGPPTTNQTRLGGRRRPITNSAKVRSRGLSSRRPGTVDNSCRALGLGFPCLRGSGSATRRSGRVADQRRSAFGVQPSPACSAAPDGLMSGRRIMRDEFTRPRPPAMSGTRRANCSERLLAWALMARTSASTSGG
jgi:hypothetical protein